MKNVEKTSKSKLAARILAIVLAVLMVTGMAYYTIYMLVLKAQDDGEDEKKTAAITEIIDCDVL